MAWCQNIWGCLSQSAYLLSFFFFHHVLLWSAVSLNPDPVDESCASSQTCLAAPIAHTQPDKQLLTIWGTSTFLKNSSNRDFSPCVCVRVRTKCLRMFRRRKSAPLEAPVRIVRSPTPRRPLSNIWINYLESERAARHKTRTVEPVFMEKLLFSLEFNCFW